MLARKNGESIVIGKNIIIKVISVDSGTVRLGVEAPRDLPVYRQEIYQAICEENLRAVGSQNELNRLQKMGPQGNNYLPEKQPGK